MMTEIGRMKQFMQSLMKGELPADDVVRFLEGIEIKDLTVEMLVEAAEVMRENAERIAPKAPVILDTCGTGGDGLKTINVSTLCSLIAASSGVVVAKHGNRAVSSISGSADILKSLGLTLDLTPDQVLKCIDATGFGFMFAPLFHPAMKHAKEARERLKKRTLFNVLGPLTNPAGATHQLLGVFDPSLVEKVCLALGQMGSKHVIVVHGKDGSDEVSLSSQTLAAEWQEGSMKTFAVNPEEYGLRYVDRKVLTLESTEAITEATELVLKGQKGPHTDFVVLNAAFALTAANRVQDVREGMSLAEELLTSGAVKSKLNEIIRFSAQLR